MPHRPDRAAWAPPQSWFMPWQVNRQSRIAVITTRRYRGVTAFAIRAGRQHRAHTGRGFADSHCDRILAMVSRRAVANGISGNATMKIYRCAIICTPSPAAGEVCRLTIRSPVHLTQPDRPHSPGHWSFSPLILGVGLPVAMITQA